MEIKFERKEDKLIGRFIDAFEDPCYISYSDGTLYLGIENKENYGILINKDIANALISVLTEYAVTGKIAIVERVDIIPNSGIDMRGIEITTSADGLGKPIRIEYVTDRYFIGRSFNEADNMDEEEIYSIDMQWYRYKGE